NLATTRTLREAGVPAVYGDAGFPEVLGAAKPETARMIVVAIPERGNVRRIIAAAREANPDIEVVVRTHSDAEHDWLRAQNIDRVVMVERRTALEIADHALEAFGRDPPGHEPEAY